MAERIIFPISLNNNADTYKFLSKVQNDLIDSNEILYLIFDYPHKHYTFKYFEV